MEYKTVIISNSNIASSHRQLQLVHPNSGGGTTWWTECQVRIAFHLEASPSGYKLRYAQDANAEATS
jgi:hypothetical protein